MQWVRPTGCDYCRQSGYRGRTGIYELLEITPEIVEAMLDKAPVSVYERLAVASGMVPMFQDGLRKVRAGVTTMEEVMAVCELKTDVLVPEPTP